VRRIYDASHAVSDTDRLDEVRLEMRRRKEIPHVFLFEMSDAQRAYFKKMLSSDTAYEFDALHLAKPLQPLGVVCPPFETATYGLEAVMEKYWNDEGYAAIHGAMTGSEGALFLVDQINAVLGAPFSNDASTAEVRCDKVLMHEVLQKAGIRYIPTCLVRSAEEALLQMAMADITFPVVLKPAKGAGSQYLTYCTSERDVGVSFDRARGNSTLQRSSAELMCLSPYIDGEEFVVNTVSCKGVHIVTDVWRSFKFPRELDKYHTILYDRLDFVRDSTAPDISPVVDYTLKCLDVLGTLNGAAHCEVRVDRATGEPVLIELNPRQQGDVPRGTSLLHYDQTTLMSYFLRAANRAEFAWPPPPIATRYVVTENRTKTILFLWTAAPSVQCNRGRCYLEALPTFAGYVRLPRKLEKPTGPTQIASYEQSVDLFTTPATVALEGTPVDVGRDTALVHKMLNGRLDCLKREMEDLAVVRTNFMLMPPEADERAPTLREYSDKKAELLMILRQMNPPALFVSHAMLDCMRRADIAMFLAEDPGRDTPTRLPNR